MKRAHSGSDSLAAVIIVGGPTGATQFRPLSLDLPKPLFPIAGKPMIYHHISACAKVEGLNEIFLLGGFEEDIFSPFISTVTKEFGVKVTYLKEARPMGTAGGILHFKDRILDGHSFVFILHSDICCSFPLKEVLNSHKAQKGAYLTMMGTKVDASAAPTYGCYVADDKGKMLHYAEHPESFISETINAGVYVFSPEALNPPKKSSKKSDVDASDSETEDSASVSMERQLLPSLVADGRAFVYTYTDFWRSIKNAGGAVYASKVYLQWYSKTKPEMLKPPSNLKCEVDGHVIVDPTATVDPSAKIGPNVYVGPNTKVGKGVRLSNSIVLGNVTIKDHACVLYSIIAEDCTVGQWTRLEGIPSATAATLDGSDTRFRRHGITMFGKGVSANSEIIVRNCIVMPHKGISKSVFNEILL